jgi:hypothetical protein
VIRVKQADVDSYIESCRIPPGSLEHLYPATLGTSAPKASPSGSVVSGTTSSSRGTGPVSLRALASTSTSKRNDQA